MTSPPVIDAIVLAAGDSTRFGSDKRLFTLDGITLLQRSLSALLPAVRQVIVVLKADDVYLLPALLGPWQERSEVIPLLLEEPQQGMGSNLARAVLALSSECDGVLIALGDMPFLQVQTVSGLVAAFQRERILLPTYHGRSGHPVLFPRRYFAELAALTGDRGGKAIVERHRAEVVCWPVADAGVLHDVDQPGDVNQHQSVDQQA